MPQQRDDQLGQEIRFAVGRKPQGTHMPPLEPSGQQPVAGAGYCEIVVAKDLLTSWQSHWFEHALVDEL